MSFSKTQNTQQLLVSLLRLTPRSNLTYYYLPLPKPHPPCRPHTPCPHICARRSTHPGARLIHTRLSTRLRPTRLTSNAHHRPRSAPWTATVAATCRLRLPPHASPIGDGDVVPVRAPTLTREASRSRPTCINMYKEGTAQDTQDINSLRISTSYTAWKDGGESQAGTFVSDDMQRLASYQRGTTEAARVECQQLHETTQDGNDPNHINTPYLRHASITRVAAAVTHGLPVLHIRRVRHFPYPCHPYPPTLWGSGNRDGTIRIYGAALTHNSNNDTTLFDMRATFS